MEELPYSGGHKNRKSIAHEKQFIAHQEYRQLIQSCFSHYSTFFIQICVFSVARMNDHIVAIASMQCPSSETEGERAGKLISIRKMAE